MGETTCPASSGGKTWNLQGIRIPVFLVVDDQFNVRRMVFNFLRTFGYTKVTDASDGLDAWQKLEQTHVDFIICDWNMPNMTGLDLLKKIRNDEALRNIPFLMVTAEVVEDIVAEAIEEGVDGYIVKPFQAQTLMDRIDHIIEKRRNPQPVDAALDRGAGLMHQGKYEDALKSFEEAINLAPKSPRTLLAMGEALEALEKEEAALSRYHEAADMANRFVKARDRLASLYAKRGQMEEATQQMRAAARISPRNARRQLNLGKALLQQGNLEEGLDALKMAQKAAANDSDLISEVGDALLDAGLNEQAAQVFSDAVSIDPQKVHIYNRLGIAYRRQKRFDKAMEIYRQALEVVPDDENLLYNVALALAEQKQFAESKKLLQKALDIRPGFKEAQMLLAKLP